MTTLKRKITLSLVCVALATLSGCDAIGAGLGQAQPESPTPTPAPLPTRVLAARSTVGADGVLVLATPALALAFEHSAPVTTVNVEAGQTVQAGTLLATLDDTGLKDALKDAQMQLDLTEAQLRQQAAPIRKGEITAAKSALNAAVLQYNVIKRGATASDIEQARLAWEAAKAQYLSAQSDRDLACGRSQSDPNCLTQEASYGSAYESERAAYDRYQELLKPVTKEKLTQAYANLVAAQTRVQALEGGLTPEQRSLGEAQYNQAKSAVARAQANLSKTQLVSPCNCVVQEVNVAVGNLPSGAAFTLVNLTGIQFKTTNLSERDIAVIKENNAATVRLKAFGRAFRGKVVSILAKSSGQQGGSALFTVLITLDKSDALLLPGMTGQAEIATQ